MRTRSITAYGTVEDVEKLAVLSEQSGRTASSWLVHQLRSEYERLYGDIEPHNLRKSG